jgi:hypothetical protein
MSAGRDPKHRGPAGERTQSVRLPPQVFQPVSSMLTAAAVLIRCSSSVYGPASASPARWMIASTDPVASSTPK